MTILHVVTAWPRHPGDVITPWLVELVRLQESYVLAPAYRGGPSADRVFRWRYLPARWETATHDEAFTARFKLVNLLKLPFLLVGGCLEARRVCRKLRPDIIHVHWPLPLALVGLAGARACGARMVYHFYGAELSLGRRLPFGWLFWRWAIPKADHLLCISSDTARQLREAVRAPGVWGWLEFAFWFCYAAVLLFVNPEAALEESQTKETHESA